MRMYIMLIIYGMIYIIAKHLKENRNNVTIQWDFLFPVTNI